MPLGANESGTPVERVLGILTCSRLLLPKLANTSEEGENSLDEGGGHLEDNGNTKRKSLLENLLQLYELCLHYSGHSDHNVVSHALETLLQMLRTPTKSLMNCLISPTGLSKSFIFQQTSVGEKGVVSRVSSFMVSEEEENLLDLEPSISEVPAALGKVQMMEAPDQQQAQIENLSSVSSLQPREESCDSLAYKEGSDAEEDSFDKLGQQAEDVYDESEEVHEEEDVEEAHPMDLDNIGGFCDADIPLIYCARRLVLNFLLSRHKSVPNARTRVSVQVLAFGCLTAIVRLSPKIFLLTLLADADEEAEGTPLIRDVINFSSHSDPQLRGCAARLLGVVLRGALIEGGGDLPLWFNGRRPDHIDMASALEKMVTDEESAMALRQVLAGLTSFVSPLLLSPAHTLALPLLERSLLVHKSTKYWLVKVELCELASSLHFTALALTTGSDELQRRFKEMLFSLLEDEDQRVRSAAVRSLVVMTPKLYYSVDDTNEDPVITAAIETSEDLLHPIVGEKKNNRLEKRLFRIVTEVTATLNTSDNVFRTSGCIEALTALAEEFAPEQNHDGWGCHVPRVRKSSCSKTDKVLSGSAFCLLELTVHLMTKSSAGASDLTSHANLLRLSTRIFRSLAAKYLNYQGDGTATSAFSRETISSNESLNRVASLLLHHCAKLVAICASILDESIQQQSLGKVSSVTGSTTSITSPNKKKSSDISGGGNSNSNTLDKKQMRQQSVVEGQQQQQQQPIEPKRLGAFSQSVHYLRVQAALRSVDMIRRRTLDSKSAAKFNMILKNSLDCITGILDFSIGNCLGRHVEEFLAYVKSGLTVEPIGALDCVRTLLKCLFGTNAAATTEEMEKSSQPVLPNQRGLFYACFDVPCNELVHTFHLARDTGVSTTIEPEADSGFLLSGWKATKKQEQHQHGHFKVPAKASDRPALSSYVRLFEPVVIKSLKHYTLTSDAKEQASVLHLLVQLVQLRINYCLLDSDQIFVGYVLRQLELVEEGQLANADLLVPNIFRFLVLLSYEKFHSKPIIDVAKILRLCERLLSSGPDGERCVIAALVPITDDLFLYRSVTSAASLEPAELESHRQTVLTLLLRLSTNVSALECLLTALTALRVEGEDKWRRLSRNVMDTLISLLANQRVGIDNKHSLDTVFRVLAALSPGCLRPVDPFLSAVLTCAIDLSNLTEVQRWLGFVVVVLPIITNQSPEEGILGRLEELGIQVGASSSSASSLLNTSMESSTSTNSDPLGVTIGHGVVKPEVTLANFLVQVVGASCSKLHQLMYSQTLEEGHGEFLIQELSHLLHFVGYMFQSGLFVRVTRAAQALAAGKDSGDLMYSVVTVSELFLQLSHATPFLTLQWLHILILLDYGHQSFWAKVLLPPVQGTQTDHGLHQEIVRRGGLILFCDFLCDHTANVESTTWLVVNFVSDIVASLRDIPVQDFVRSMHSSQSSSGLLLQAVASYCERHQRQRSRCTVAFLRQTLDAVEHTHPHHNGKLLLFLTKHFLLSPHASLARSANQLACNRVESILRGSATENLKTEVSGSELAELLELLRDGQVAHRYAILVSLLNRLSQEYYELSPIEAGEGQNFLCGAGGAFPASVDREWYVAQARSRCCCSAAGGERSPDVCAELLSPLEYEEITAIMQRKDFDLEILVHCLERRKCDEKNDIEENENPLLKASRDVFMQHVSALVGALPEPFSIFSPTHWVPTPAQAKYTHKLKSSFQSEDFRESLVLLMTCMYAYLEGKQFKIGDGNEEEVKIFARFGVLSLEYLKLLTSDDSDCIDSGKEHGLQRSLQCVAAVLRCSETSLWLAAEKQAELVVSAAFCIRSFFKHFIGAPRTKLAVALSLVPVLEDASSPNFPAALACVKMCETFDYVVISRVDFRSKSKNLSSVLESVVFGLCRMPIFATYVRVPSEVWGLGWNAVGAGLHGTLFPILAVDFLQELEILSQYVLRITRLGWLTRQQFEEVWVSLLGVFGLSREDLSEEEARALGQSSALAVSALTNVILSTAMLPRPGLPDVSTYIHYARDLPSQFLLSPRGRQLTVIQNFIQRYMENSGSPHFLRVDCSSNLERCCFDYKGDSDVYGPAQVSLAYISSAIKHFEEPSNDASSSSSTALALPFLLREESLASVGVDVQSCLHLLFDLYAQWLSAPDTPLVLLTAMVRSLLMLSDLFTETRRFAWMLESLVELQRTHPIEDDILSPLLCLGTCKAMAMAGSVGGTSENREIVRRSLEHCLRSAHLPSKVLALHGALYLLQSELVSEVSPWLLSLVTDYLRTYLQTATVSSPVQCQQHGAVMWATAFYILENFEHDIPDKQWTRGVVQLAVSCAGQLATPPGQFLLLLGGLERLVVGGRLGAGLLDQVINLAADLLTEPSPSLAIPAAQLFLAGMYASSTTTTETSVLAEMPSGGIQDPERLMRAMEQMSILFDCVRRAGPREARLLCRVLPRVLVDFFPAADVIQRVVTTFLSPGQPHQVLLAGVLFAVFSHAATQGQSAMLRDWVLMALPNFARRQPASHSTWCLTCFFLAATAADASSPAAPWLRALFPQLQRRFGWFEAEDRRLFCLAAREFYRGLKEQDQTDSFKEIFEMAAAAMQDAPYRELLQIL